MDKHDRYDTALGLSMEREGWTRRIEQSLASVALDIQRIDDTTRPESREGWLVIERALRCGADALRALSQLQPQPQSQR